MQDTLHHVQENARSATLGEHTVWYKWGCIIVQMGDAHYQHLGDAAIDALSRPSCAHYRTDGGRIVVQMGDDTIDALSSPSCAHYRTDGGRIIVQMGDAAIEALSSPSCAPLSYRWGMLP